MDIHNATEDIVFSKIRTIFDSIKDEGNPEKFCLCNQCQMDTACYVLNRSEPRYVVSNRGVARLENEGIERQQIEADIASLVYEGLKRVNHNLRPDAVHSENLAGRAAAPNTPVFNIPTIVGRIFNGTTFAPMAGIKIELHRNGELVIMKDCNWQNPYSLVSNTEGTFTFWPNPIPAETPEARKIFEYLVKIESPGYEPLNHFFKIPVTSEIQSAVSFSMGRTFKLPDLYLFPPNSAEEEMQYNV
ncbi:MAG: late competence development ComFB family protein [Treponema sp.]|jgi:competence protein ComFB|nr:late competence development ComFB family protein [Treponema sp.]